MAELLVAPPQEFFRLLALGNIAADDDHFFDFAAIVSHRAAAGFEDAPIPILALEAIFHAWTDALLKSFYPGGNQRLAIVRMDLLRERSPPEFLVGISEFVVPGTVVKARAFAIHDGNQVLGILCNQAEHLFLVAQLPANAMDEELLVDRIQIEQKNEPHQGANGLPEGE